MGTGILLQCTAGVAVAMPNTTALYYIFHYIIISVIITFTHNTHVDTMHHLNTHKIKDICWQ